MIQSFKDGEAEKIHRRQPGRRYAGLERIVLRKLRALDAARLLIDLTIPPGNRLEALKGNRAGQHSIRINQQWRICFRWEEPDAYEVEIVDYR